MKAGLTTSSDISRAAVDGMAQVTIERMQGAREELLRADELLAHAIEQLMSAFNNVSEPARHHLRQLMLAAAAANGTPAADKLRAEAERIEQNVNGAVTALQFRDVVGQKLGHVRSELAALEQAMHGIREVSAQCAHGAHGDLAAGVDGVLQQLQEDRAASPVRQKLMHAGEIELF